MDAATRIDPWDGPLDYERIKALASRERPAYTLIAMAEKNDPFYIRPGRQKKAEWFTALWREHCQNRFDSQGRPSLMHIRRIHYILISLPDRPRMEGNGKPYANTERCFTAMDEASRDARLLDLVSIGRIIDQRNDAPVEYLPNYADVRQADRLAVDHGPTPSSFRGGASGGYQRPGGAAHYKGPHQAADGARLEQRP